MTCKQLGGACDKEFHSKTFEEMAEMSNLMNDPETMNDWMINKQKEFNELPEEE